MADETKRIEALHGPYAGQHIDIASADADQAIADGWARDPYAPAAEPGAFDQEKYDAMLVAAEKAARKMRGEEKEPEPVKGRQAKPAEKTSTAKPQSGDYQTRRSDTKE